VSSPVSSRLEEARESPVRDDSGGRLALPAIFLCGVTLSFLGAILPAWRSHLEASFSGVGNYFLSLAVGFAVSSVAAQVLLLGRGGRFLLTMASVWGCVGFAGLALASWAESPMGRCAGLFCAGASAGFSSAAIFQSIGPPYRPAGRGAASTAIRIAILFGSGCLLTALVMAGAYSVVPLPAIFAALAVLAGVSAAWLARSRPAQSAHWQPYPLSEIWRELKTPGVVLLSLLLFFQFGNEWSIAGWLPLFLIRRLGMSPRTSLLILALYWTALLSGRLAAQWVIPRMSRAGLLAGSIFSALLGTVVLASTNNAFGAVMGVLFAGAGFAPILPLVARKIGRRFAQHPAQVFGGLFTFALMGGLLAPWVLSFFASAWGVQAVMLLPMAGACMVLALTLLILLEAKLSGWQELKGSGL
jgi:FHS family glucose/mannose:H+ symporter-like MFS transporter